MDKCLNVNNGHIQKLSKITGLPPASVASRVAVWQSKNGDKIPKMQDLGMEFIPWSKNIELYKKYNLITTDGKRKTISETEARKWAETNNGSPEYYFEPLKIDTEGGWSISIAKRLWNKSYVHPDSLPKDNKPQNPQLPLFDQTGTNNIKKGVPELFESNPELASIGTAEQYSQYLDTIFPDSKVKDIVYHGSYTKIDKFLKEFLGKNTKAESAKKGFFFGSSFKNSLTYVENILKQNKKIAFDGIIYINLNKVSKKTRDEFYNIIKSDFSDDFDGILTGEEINNLPPEIKELPIFSFGILENEGNITPYSSEFLSYKDTEWRLNQLSNFQIDFLDSGKKFEEFTKEYVHSVILDIKNPLIVSDNKSEYREESYSNRINKAFESQNDSLIIKDTKDPLDTDVYTVFEPEQIHILGSKQDIEGFKKFVKKDKLLLDEAISYELKAIDILKSNLAASIFEKGNKNKWDLNKILTELQIPKEQKQLILESGKTTREEIITDLLGNYSYTVEINTAKDKTPRSFALDDLPEDMNFVDNFGNQYTSDYSNTHEGYDYFKNGQLITKNEFDKAYQNSFEKVDDSQNTQYYSNLTVPGGTNYTENEIATPLITPSIKGHAQFATDNGIGWFRSDDRRLRTDNVQQIEEEDPYGLPVEAYSTFKKEGTETKTRRILEVQSDLFQKGRDKKILSGKFEKTGQGEYELFDKLENSNDNQFLQLLNKENNWVTFFVKSIIQDSIKKGYEKVLFPTGNTASKVEGHTTLEEFKKQKEDRIKVLETELLSIENGTYEEELGPFASNPSKRKKSITDEINQLKQELERVEREGFGALRPIYNFYENTVTNILKKNYNVNQITDEYGNTWNEINLENVDDKVLLDVAKNERYEQTLTYTNSKKILEEIAASKHALSSLAKVLLRYNTSVPVIPISRKDFAEKFALPDGTVPAAAYSPSEKVIYMIEGASYKYSKEVTLLHEIIHHLTYEALRQDTQMNDEFKELYEHVKQFEFTDDYPLSSLDEFIVGIFTNPKFISELRSLPSRKGKKFTSAWDDILNFFRRLLKIPFENKTLFEESFALASTLLNEYNTAKGEILSDEAFFADVAAPQSQKEVYEMLNPLGKISKDDNGYVVLGERGYRRITEIIQKFRNLNNLKNTNAQVIGDIFHYAAANEIAKAFPEFNKHYVEQKLEGLSPATLLNIKQIIVPIIEAAKAEGSVLVVELPVASTKRKIAGTIDLIKITPTLEVKMLDYKTSAFSRNPTTKYKKVRGNSDQQKLYKSILEETDNALGRKGLNVERQDLMYLKAKVSNGNIMYSVQETIPIIYQPTKNEKRNQMLATLFEQIEHLSDNKNKTNADKIDRLIAAKRELMIKLQNDIENDEIYINVIADLAAIENLISTQDDTLNYIEFRNDLTLYSKLGTYLKPENEAQRSTIIYIQGRASQLLSEIFESSADSFKEKVAEDLSFEGSPIQSKEDVTKAVKDINITQAWALSASYSQNPILAGFYKQVSERLAVARNKALSLGKEVSKLKQELNPILGSGISMWEPFLQYRRGKKTGYLVDKYKSEFYDERKSARTEGDISWFRENTTFDAEKYEQAKERFKAFIEWSTPSNIASEKARLAQKEKYTPEQIDKYAQKNVEEMNQKRLADWVKENQNIMVYNKPKDNWIDPKWRDIKEGKYKGTAVERFYDLYTSTMEELEEALPFDVSKNFIADFKKSFIDRLINVGPGNMKLGESLVDQLSINFDEAEVNKINPFTGKMIRNIPVLGRRTFKTSDERADFIEKEKSYDLAYSLAVFYESAVRYMELKTIESSAEVARGLLLEQKEVITNSLNEVATGGYDVVKVGKGLDNTIAQFEFFVDSTIYKKPYDKETGFKLTGNSFTETIGFIKKGDEKVISWSKLLDSVLKYTGLNNIGYNLYSPITNLLGGKSMQLLTGFGERWYSVKDYSFGSVIATAGKFSNATPDVVKGNLFIEKFGTEMHEFAKESFDKLKSTAKLPEAIKPFALMQGTESHMQNAGLIAMIKSNKHSIKWNEWEVEDGKLVYKGDSEMNEGIEEAFRQKAIHVNSMALGNMNPDDKIMLKKWFLGRAVIQHRGWIPAMFVAHYSSRRYDYMLQDYVEGRINSALSFIFKKSLTWSKLDEIEKANIKELIAETGIIVSSYLLLVLIKGGDTPEDEERRKKLAYTIRVLDRYNAEMSFFTPFEVSGKYQILISPAPAVSSLENLGRFLNNNRKYLLAEEEEKEEEMKKLKKSAKRLVPFYSQLDRFVEETIYNNLERDK